MLLLADEDNDDVIESFWQKYFSVLQSFTFYYLDWYIYRSNLCRSVWENYKTYRDDRTLIRKEIKWSME